VSNALPQTLTMTLSVDADLWRAFERAADRAQRPCDDVVRDLMRAFAVQQGPGLSAAEAAMIWREAGLHAPDAFSQPVFDFTVDVNAGDLVDGQIDLEDFLKGSARG
jgi:hypothetical protein